MQALQRFWARSVLNKVTILLSFSLLFCCCGWTGRLGGAAAGHTASAASPHEAVSESPGQRVPGW